AVVDVGEVHHLADVVAEQVLQRSTQDVDADKGAEVADVPTRVDRQAARIHANRLAIERLERLLAARQRVVEAHHDPTGSARERVDEGPPANATVMSI